MLIRNFHPGDEPALRAVFFSSVHDLARHHYTAKQLDVWAPRQYDAARWGAQVRGNQPFIAEVDGSIAGFADLQDSGYVDHFFVAGDFAGRGVGRALMAHLHQSAAARGIGRLFADVSLSAEPFFQKWGFGVEARQQVERAGVVLANARMSKLLATICS